LAQPEEDRHLCHPFGVRVGLSFRARDCDDRAPGPYRRRDQDRDGRAARRGIPHLRRLWRILPQGLGGAGAILFQEIHAMSAAPNGRMPTAARGDGLAFRILRIALPVIVAAAATGTWELVVRHYEIPPYVLPSPSAILATLISDWDVLFQSLLTTLLTTL